MRRRQAGEGKGGCILWLLVLLIVGFISWKAVPVKLASAEFYDFMEEQAKFAGDTPPEVLKRRILEKARELELPIGEKQVSVERVGDQIRMRCVYEIALDFPGYTYVWKFDESIKRPIFSI